MNRDDRRSQILDLRTKDLVGKFVILRPASMAYAKDIMELRNRPNNRYWFNQANEITLEGQEEWFKSYDSSCDDIYWVILDKGENFIGTIRLYGIDMDGDHCEEGSYVIDEKVAVEAPYAVESKMLALDVAFSDLKIEKMINDNRADNKIMNNIDDQLGFEDGSLIKIRGVDYIHRILYAKDYFSNRVRFSTVIDYWSER